MSKKKELSGKDIIDLLSFCLYRGDHMECHTDKIVHPLTQDEMEQAFRAKELAYKRIIKSLLAMKEAYDKDPKSLSQDMVWRINWSENSQGYPDKKTVYGFIAKRVEEIKALKKRIRTTYSVSVDCSGFSPRIVEFHQSLNPVVKFLPLSPKKFWVIHNHPVEACSFRLKGDQRKAFTEALEEPDDVTKENEFLIQTGTLRVSLYHSAIDYSDIKISLKDRVLVQNPEKGADAFSFNEDDVRAYLIYRGSLKKAHRTLKKLGIKLKDDDGKDDEEEDQD